MSRPTLRVSLVIPAYNEESHLAACLDAIAAQTVRPFEVIVVDNNSADGTALVAQSYPFVRIVAEPRQGIVFARDAGFNAARGDIIGRIDADTILPADWVQTAIKIFTDNPYDAVSGSVGYYDIPLKRTVASIDLWFRQTIARKLRHEVYLYGGNMAIRRSAWQAVCEELCHAHQLHEDFDLAVHLAQARCNVRFDPTLCAQVSARCVDYSPRSFYTYVMANPRTYAAHGLTSQRCMYPLTIFMLSVYFLVRFLYRASDPQNGRFSLRYLFDATYKSHPSPLAEL